MFRYDLKTLTRILHLGGFLLLMVLGLCLYFLVYRPLGDLREQNLTNAERVAALLKYAPAVESRHRHLRRQLKEFERSAAITRRRIPTSADEEEFLADVDAIASELHLKVANHKIGEIHELGKLRAMEVDFDCRGSYDSICRFFAAVEQLARITKTSSFELGAVSNSFGYPFQVTFVLYYAPSTGDTREGGRSQ